MASARKREEWSELALGVLGEAGHRAGGARQAVVQLLAGEDCCLSAQEIAEGIRSGGDRVGTASVYRALDLLHRTGLVQRVELGDGGARYEALVPGGDHHHHVICDRCGRITPFEDPALERAIERLAGRLRHRVSGHDVVVRGLCPGCARTPRSRS
ncbi:MAG: ferric uptake regulator, Fur family [Solirubrobacterales bacterium]|jgi:Fur family ferric uptake transcriptional regulator|nr:ferric uptake regulator, Fur family [Solirubrobacterales bacterium]